MITLKDIQLAQTRIRGIAVRTPLLAYPGSAPNRSLFLKPENLQPMGAFKLRGAYNAIASLTPAERERGVVTHSSGNHAQAVAYAARALGVKAIIVIPSNAPKIKIDKTKGYGAEVVLVGNSSEERLAKFESLAKERNLVPVPPYDDERVMAGQGTIGLEILEDLPDAELALVPVSGGGLISGIAAALKLSRSNIKVIGVEPELAADAQESLRSGTLTGYTAEQVSRTIADGLRVQKLGALTWPHIQAYVDDIVTVSEDEIRNAMRTLAFEARLVAEPSGAVPFAAWLYRQNELPAARQTVAVISGGNVEPQVLAQVLA
ncbi:MAG: pyridoxal-phosphate dependent enzyme [Chloroflexi bacterium]|nr:pyridoxal-phosphate dependent enzyme [Chloroflexota bacterium]